MDKITKALQKLSPQEHEKIKGILKKLKSGNIKNLDIKKLKDRNDIYRVRLGNIRIIYRKDISNRIHILAVARRNKKTYK